MVIWWKIRFDGVEAGTFGYLKLDGTNLIAIALYHDDGSLVTGDVDYTTIETNVPAPDWA